MNILASTSFIGNTGYANHSKSFFTALDKLTPVKVRNFTIGDSWTGMSNTPHDGEYYMTDQIKKMLFSQTLWTGDGDNKSREDFPMYSFENDKVFDINIVLNETDHFYFYDSYGNYKIAYNVWESTLQPPGYFNRIKDYYHELWVPSQWQKDVTIAQGFPADKIFVIPEGVDVNTFKPLENPQYPDKFRFMIFGRWDYRKYIKETIEAWLKAFPRNKYKDVELLLSVENPFSVDGMKSTAERLQRYGLQDPRIKIVKFPPRQEYINYLQTGHVFLSCARSEGWNLPLIEALSCGTPSIYSNCSAQLEFTKGEGLAVNVLGEEPASKGDGKSFRKMPGNYYKPDFQHLVKTIRDAYENYEHHKQVALQMSERIRRDFTWEKQAELAHDRLKVIYSENFKDGKFIKKQTPKIVCNFINKAFVQVEKSDEDIKVEFWDKKEDKLVFETKLKEGHWAAPNRSYFTDWKIIAKDPSGEVVFQHDYNCENKRVYIALESRSLGDTLAWFPQLEEFRKKHNCKLVVSTFWNHFFESNYPEIEFIKPGIPVGNLYAMYKVGWFYDKDVINLDHNPVDPKSRPLQATASDILGLEYKEIVPKIIKPERPNRYGKKFVCFSPHASASAKYWHNEQGWQAVINYIKNVLGYEVVMISKEKYNDNWETSKLPGNKKFEGIIDATGDFPIEERMADLLNCEFFIGVGSGLSWLAWALNKKVIMISGFSDVWAEFETNCTRIINKKVCNSCFNNFKLDAGDWNWCPAHKDTPRHFECTKQIPATWVVDAINQLAS
jgi:autotransporter strand-loop-strand O-heptosyltransferase